MYAAIPSLRAYILELGNTTITEHTNTQGLRDREAIVQMTLLDKFYKGVLHVLADEWVYDVRERDFVMTLYHPTPNCTQVALDKIRCAGDKMVGRGADLREVEHDWIQLFNLDANYVQVADILLYNNSSFVYDAFFRIRGDDTVHCPDGLDTHIHRRMLNDTIGNNAPLYHLNPNAPVLKYNAPLLLARNGYVPLLRGCEKVHDGKLYFEQVYVPTVANRLYLVDAGNVWVVDSNSVKDCKDVLRRALVRFCVLRADGENDDDDGVPLIRNMIPFASAYHNENQTLTGELIHTINSEVQDNNMKLCTSLVEVVEYIRECGIGVGYVQISANPVDPTRKIILRMCLGDWT